MAVRPPPPPQSNIPIPDPTILTTDQLRREINALRELLDARLVGMDNVTSQIAGSVQALSVDVQKHFDHLREVRDEKFASIAARFNERDMRFSTADSAARAAVEAALQAQKDSHRAQNEANAAAITKSEAATTKQIDSILALLQSNNTALSDKIWAINSRLDRGEGLTTGHSASLATIISIGAVLASFISLGVGMFVAFKAPPPPPPVLSAPLVSPLPPAANSAR